MIHAHRLVDVPIIVVSRPGGSGTIALTQLVASPGDDHVLLMGTLVPSETPKEKI